MLKADVLAHFGGPTATARALQITPVAVHKWKELIPRGSAYQVQAITGGQLVVNPADYPPKRFKNHEA